MTALNDRIEREDEQDRLRTVNAELLAATIGNLLRLVDAGTLASWSVSFPEREATLERVTQDYVQAVSTEQDFPCTVCGEPNADWDVGVDELRCGDHMSPKAKRVALIGTRCECGALYDPELPGYGCAR